MKTWREQIDRDTAIFEFVGGFLVGGCASGFVAASVFAGAWPMIALVGVSGAVMMVYLQSVTVPVFGMHCWRFTAGACPIWTTSPEISDPTPNS